MQGKIQDKVPYFKKLSLGYCDVVALPENGSHRRQALKQNYLNKNYSIDANYYDHRSVGFEILVITDITRYQVDNGAYRIDWRFLCGEESQASYIYEERKSQVGAPSLFTPNPKTALFLIKIPSVVTVGKHTLEIRIFRNEQEICDWKGIAYFTVCDTDLDEHDKVLLRHGAIVGAACALIGAAIMWVLGNLSTLANIPNWFLR